MRKRIKQVRFSHTKSPHIENTAIEFVRESKNKNITHGRYLLKSNERIELIESLLDSSRTRFCVFSTGVDVTGFPKVRQLDSEAK